MARERFKKQETGSFFGQWLYGRIVPKDHFLRKLDAIIPWEGYTNQLLQLYRGGAMYGRPPYNPVMILKMLLLAYLYDLSERSTEQQVNDSLAMKCFLGLAVDEPSPHHSTLSKFRERLIRNGREEALEELLASIVRLALERGVQFGSIQVIDSVHTIADVNTAKDERRQRKEGKPPRDADAAWGVKGTKRQRDEDGKLIQKRQYFHGYKAHVSLNSGSELITSLTVTPGNAFDGHRLPELVERDLAKEVPIATLTATGHTTTPLTTSH